MQRSLTRAFRTTADCSTSASAVKAYLSARRDSATIVVADEGKSFSVWKLHYDYSAWYTNQGTRTNRFVRQQHVGLREDKNPLEVLKKPSGEGGPEPLHL